MGDDGIFRRPAVPQPVRIRRDVHKLPPGDKTLFWYEKAIQAMKKLPLSDVLSWRYQAAIHETDGVAPPAQRDFWKQCQHSSWFFLPWHRMYLHFFEKIVAAQVVALQGPADWALPYWNYSASAASSLVPEAFRLPAHEDTNALFVSKRRSTANAGSPFLSTRDIDISCLLQRPFAFQDARSIGFGGPRRLFHDLSGDGGALENAPHNLVHTALGGNDGFMTFPATAPLDPLFWLHHCNIDRLWEVWVQRQKQQGNADRNPSTQATSLPPQTGLWRTTSFMFHNETRKPIGMTVREVLDTRVAPLSYEYEDTSDPFPGQS